MSSKEPPGGITPQVHVDEVRYVVRLTPHPAGGSADVAQGFVVWWGELDVSLDEAAKLSTAVAWDAKHDRYEAYVAEQSFTQFEWGASGYGLSFLIDLANSISADLVVGGMAYAVGKMRGKKQRKSRWTPEEGLDAAVESARRAVVAVFEEQYEALRVDDSTQVGNTVQVRLSGTQGSYAGTLTTLEPSGDPICHVTVGNARK